MTLPPDEAPAEKHFNAQINVEAKDGKVVLHLPKGLKGYVEPEIARELAGHLIGHSYVAEGRPAPDQVTIHFKDEDSQ